MSKQIKGATADSRLSDTLNAIGGTVVKVLKCLLRGLALFLAMNDRVGYAMREDDERTCDS